MDFNVIREYLVSQNIVGENIFLFEKPLQVKADDYIIYNFKELDGGSTIRIYQLDVRVVSKDKLKAIEIKDKVINALDIYYKTCKIKNEDTTIRNIRLTNGGGMIRNDETGEYNVLTYFIARI